MVLKDLKSAFQHGWLVDDSLRESMGMKEGMYIAIGSDTLNK